MFGRKKPQQDNAPAIVCPNCHMRFVGEQGKTWTVDANAQRFERVGGPDSPLTQTWPPKPQAVKSATRIRIEQSIAVGVAVSLCPATCALSVGQSPSLTALAALGSFATLVSSSTFVLSVALGADNWATIFRWLDRNDDGRITRADIEEMFNDWFGGDEPDAPGVPSVQVEKGLMVINNKGVGRKLCPTLPRPQVLEMARKSAALHLSARLPEDKRENFTKQFVGGPWGRYLTHAQATLIILGMAEKRGNNTTILNKAGSDWLAEINANA